jgi:hypothetical protein
MAPLSRPKLKCEYETVGSLMADAVDLGSRGLENGTEGKNWNVSGCPGGLDALTWVVVAKSSVFVRCEGFHMCLCIR